MTDISPFRKPGVWHGTLRGENWSTIQGPGGLPGWPGIQPPPDTSTRAPGGRQRAPGGPGDIPAETPVRLPGLGFRVGGYPRNEALGYIRGAFTAVLMELARVASTGDLREWCLHGGLEGKYELDLEDCLDGVAIEAEELSLFMDIEDLWVHFSVILDENGGGGHTTSGLVVIASKLQGVSERARSLADERNRWLHAFNPGDLFGFYARRGFDGDAG